MTQYEKPCSLLLLSICFYYTSSFVHTTTTTPTQHLVSSTLLQTQKSDALEEAQRLLEKSRALREEIAKQETQQQQTREVSTTTLTADDEKAPAQTPVSKWSVPPVEEENAVEASSSEYRLYVDIGREPGTWMEPRWGASGKRIEFTLDVRFQTDELANDEAKQKMVQDNKSGSSSVVYALQSAPLARLRSGFDQMKCGESGGAFRIDKSNKPGQSDTLRFYVDVEGTPEGGSSGYGDLFIPKGGLYFSIPCFGSVTQLSSKGEMPVTVRQMGWHTGWRREESRIVGIFRAVPIEDARRRDGF